jgi:hypothetical protein
MGEAAVELEHEAIFENAGQAVHVAFLIMAQEATQDAPLRKAIIRVMESIKLAPNQRHWLDQLRGAGGGSVNFAGLSGDEIRAQCAMITQAVKTKLPNVEMWVLQAKYGQTDFEDVADEQGDQEVAAVEQAQADVQAAREKLEQARGELTAAADAIRRATGWPGGSSSERRQWDGARESVRELEAAVVVAESRQQAAQVALSQRGACRILNNGPQPKREGVQVRRRFAFSAERIAAIQGLSDWFAPMFPRIKPFAIDCMLGRMFARHKKIDISARELADQFGGSHMKYVRAAFKMKNHVRILEEKAIARLETIFAMQGVTPGPMPGDTPRMMRQLEQYEQAESARVKIMR